MSPYRRERRARVALRIGLAGALSLALGSCRTPDAPDAVRDRPNILLIVADDLGYSDLAPYGSEIDTPNLDALADTGILATDFYVMPRGAPTRATLLTGCDNHAAGFGGALPLEADEEPPPGYEGSLSDRVVTVASLLRNAGYHTITAGKWELGTEPRNRPEARGFERSFTLYDGAASHWSDMASAVPGRDRALYTRDGEELTELPADHYSTTAFTDFVVEAIEEQRADGKPFFAYLAYQAPHGPLAAPAAWLERYSGRYDEGYDAIRGARLLRMKQKRLVREDVKPYPGIPTVPRWGDLADSQQKDQARRMEIYAAMVGLLDAEVGRLFDALRAVDEYHETLIVFLSDNGAEPSNRGPAGVNPKDREFYAKQFPLSEPESWGSRGSFVEYGPAWAQVSTVPFRLFKGTQAEGGIRSPLIVSGPGVAARGRGWFERRRITNALLHVSDLTPTFLEAAGVERPKTWRGRTLAQLKGRSISGVFEGSFRDRKGPHDWLGFGFAGDRAVRRDEWKLVWMDRPFGVADWRLYRLDRDPSELYDRSASEEDEKAELLALWEEYVKLYDIVVEGDEGEESPAQKSSPTAM